jgi:hypothetical protein
MSEKDFPNPHFPTRPAVFDFKLSHLARRLDEGGPVRIATVGSSSTAGWGDTPPYPARLEGLLRGKYFPIPIDVLNRGKGSEEAPDQLDRLKAVVIRDEPTIVIWQVGANAIFHGRPIAAVRDAIRSGLDTLASRPIDVILMDPQYLPPLLTMERIDAALEMVAIIERLASDAEMNVFRRFDYMRRMHRFERVSFDRMIEPNDLNRLHHSDWSTVRVTQALFDVMVHAVTEGRLAGRRSA